MSNWVLGVSSLPTGQGVFNSFENLTPGTIYYWRMRARYGNDNYCPSSEGSFRTPASGVILPPPVLLSPANNSTLPGTSATFKWKAVNNAEKYQLVVGLADKCTYYIVPVDGTEYTFDYLWPNERHFWHVSAVNHFAIGQPSGDWFFTSGSALKSEKEPESSILDGTSGKIHWLPRSVWLKQSNMHMDK
jgi:hypothetical protein